MDPSSFLELPVEATLGGDVIAEHRPGLGASRQAQDSRALHEVGARLRRDHGAGQATRGDREAQGLSLNRAALLLMRRGAGLLESPEASATVGSALDSFIGKWSPDEEQRLLDSIAVCESVDEELWT